MKVYAVFDGDILVGLFSWEQGAEDYIEREEEKDAELVEEFDTEPANYYYKAYYIDDLV